MRRHPAVTLGLTLAFAGLMALSARVDIPMHPVPMTMQSWAVLLSGAVLGARWGVAAVLVYLAAAAIYWILSTILAAVQTRLERRAAEGRR